MNNIVIVIFKMILIRELRSDRARTVVVIPPLRPVSCQSAAGTHLYLFVTF